MRQFIPVLLLSAILGQLSPLFAQELPQVYPFAFQQEWGVVDENRNVLLPASLDSVGFFSRLAEEATNSRAAIAIQDGARGMLNQNGEWLMKPKYSSIGDWQYYARSLRWVKSKGKFGLMDLSGKRAKWIIKPRFTAVEDFQGRKIALAIVSIGDQYGVVNNEGKIVAPCEYDAVKLLDDYSDYPDIKLTKNDIDQYFDAFGEQLPTEEMREKEEREDMWDDEIVFEDNSIEEEYSRHRSRIERITEGRQVVILERTSRGPWETIEERTVPAGYEVVEVKIQERYSPLRLNAVVLRKDNQLTFLGDDQLLNGGATYDRLEWSRSNRYDELGHVYRDGKLGIVNRDGVQLVPPAFETVVEYGILFRLTHPDGYEGFANTEGKVFLPLEVDLGQ